MQRDADGRSKTEATRHQTEAPDKGDRNGKDLPATGRLLACPAGLHSRLEAIDRRLHLVVVQHLVSGADVRGLEPLAPVVPTLRPESSCQISVTRHRGEHDRILWN